MGPREVYGVYITGRNDVSAVELCGIAQKETGSDHREYTTKKLELFCEDKGYTTTEGASPDQEYIEKCDQIT
jgi:hypothetical protein